MATSLSEDLQARMRPSVEQVAWAVEQLENWGAAEAMVPIAFPGKEYGFWTFDTEVEHPAGLYVVTCDADYGDARNLACEAAAKHLLANHGERNGTVGYVVIRATGDFAVFEDILSPASHLLFARAEGR